MVAVPKSHIMFPYEFQVIPSKSVCCSQAAYSIPTRGAWCSQYAPILFPHEVHCVPMKSVCCSQAAYSIPTRGAWCSHYARILFPHEVHGVPMNIACCSHEQCMLFPGAYTHAKACADVHVYVPLYTAEEVSTHTPENQHQTHPNWKHQ